MNLFGSAIAMGPLRGGFLGIGHSSAKTDRGNQLAATQGDWNIFSQGLGTGKVMQTAGASDINQAKQYYSGLLKAGRADTALNSAPAVNAATEGAAATRKAEGTFGTGRTGGTNEANREAGTHTQEQIDKIINENLIGGRAEGAKGLKEVGSTELVNAMSNLGLSSNAVNSILQNSTDSRSTSNAMNLQTQEQWGQLIGTLLTI